MNKVTKSIWWFGKIIIGSVIFALGFNLFLEPNALNAGGISGLAMILVHLLGFGSVGTITILMNLPLFVLGGIKIGKKFLIGSLAGMLATSIAGGRPAAGRAVWRCHLWSWPGHRFFHRWLHRRLGYHRPRFEAALGQCPHRHYQHHF